MRAILASILVVFSYVYFKNAVNKSNPQNRSIASINSKIDEAQKNKIKGLGFDGVFNRVQFSDFLQKEQLSLVESHGTLIAEAQDFDPASKNHQIKYFIQDKYSDLYPVEILSDDHHAYIGQTVQFKGTEVNGKALGFIMPSQKNQKLADAPSRPEAKTYNMLILLFKFKNSKDVFTTPEEIHNATFNGAFNRFYREISDNKVFHTGSVHGFYYLDRNGEDDGGASMPCNVSNAEIKQAIAHYGIDATKYDQITTVSNCAEYFTIGGRANLTATDFLGIGKKQHYILMAGKPDLLKINMNYTTVPGWNGFVSILVHERGHNFGLQHSNSLDCGDSQILYPCQDIEYGNRFDRMGGPYGSFLFNAYQQLQAGWKTENEFLHIKAPGLYSIDKLTAVKSGRKIGAFIYNPKNLNQKLFMLEFRVPEKMDNKLSEPPYSNVKLGAHLYSALGKSEENISPSLGTAFRIVDPKPSELDWTPDTAYESLQGEYLDVRSGLKITTYTAYADRIEFRVDYDPSDSVCEENFVNEMTSAPYVKLYFEMTPTTTSQQKKPGTDSSGSGGPIPVLDIPPFSREIKKDHIVLIPGDFFHFKIDTLIANHMICDRSNLEIQILNTSALQNYFAENTTTVHSFKRTQKNIYKKVEFPILKVPAMDLNKDKTITYQIKNLTTGEIMTKTLNIHIRSKHNVIIKLDAGAQTIRN
jgi:hypothetical protein